jgi:hypothetical protein
MCQGFGVDAIDTQRCKKYNRVYFRARLYKYDNLQVSFVAGAILSAENAKCSTNHEDFAITPRVACRFIRS